MDEIATTKAEGFFIFNKRKFSPDNINTFV